MSVPGWPIGLIFFLVIGLSIEHLFEHIHHYHQSLSSWSKWSDFVFFCLKTSFFSMSFPSVSVKYWRIITKFLVNVAKGVVYQCLKFQLILVIGNGAIQLKRMTVFLS